MVPDKFVRVDLHGIDVLESQGEEIPGLYDELVESIQLCRYQIIYNWKFNGILISPTYVELRLTEDGVKINSYITVTSEDIIHIHSIESEPVIDTLTVTENGEYLTPEGVDGFNPVTVNVPMPQPVIESKSITENGSYVAPAGVDGYNPVVVNVQGVERLNIYSGRLDIRDGTITEDENYYYTDFVNISDYRGYWFIDISRTDLSSFYIGGCFYGADGVPVDYVRQYTQFRMYDNVKNQNPVKFRIAGKVSELADLSIIHLPTYTRIFGSLGNNFVANT